MAAKQHNFYGAANFFFSVTRTNRISPGSNWIGSDGSASPRHSAIRTPPSAFAMDQTSSPSMNDKSINKSDSVGRRRLSIPVLFPRASRAEPQKTRPPPRSHRFSADGRTLLLWTECEDCVFASIIPESDSDPWAWRRYKIPGVRKVAGGGENRIAVISKPSEVKVLPLCEQITLTSPPALQSPDHHRVEQDSLLGKDRQRRSHILHSDVQRR